VTRALAKSQPFLASHSASAELVSIDEDGTVRLRLDVKVKSSGGCGSSSGLVKSTLEANLQNAAPDAPSIVVEEVDAFLKQPGFVSLAQLQNSAAKPALAAGLAEGNGD
jgi:Fe-S cluster biogenesis protein NfuA